MFSSGEFTKRPLTTLAKKFLLLCETPIGASLFALGFYVFLAIYGHNWGTTTPNNYFSYLADAFLHGQLHLRLEPASVHDLVVYQDKLYLYWPPMPAILSMPLVLLFGVDFSDITLSVCIAAVNVGLVALLLRKCQQAGLINLTILQRGLLVFTFGFASVHVTQAPIGRVWAVSQLVGVMFVIFTYLTVLALRGWKAFLLAGCAIAAAMATRNPLVLAGIWPAYYLLSQHWSEAWKKKIVYSMLGAAPVILGLVLLGAYNFARFGSVIDFGYSYHSMWFIFEQDYQEYGSFSLHYLPRNLYYQWLAYPFLAENGAYASMGGSLFLLTPVFFALFWAFKERHKYPHIAVLCLTMLAVYIPIGLLMGTGVIQFGPRYLLDLTIPLLIVTGMGLKYWPNRVTGILALISFLHYLAGTMMLMPWVK